MDIVQIGSVEAREKKLAKLFAEKFINRSDVRALQTSSGGYEPMRPNANLDPGARQKYSKQYGFDMDSLRAHIRGEKTYGHYMMKQDDTVKFFALDIDLEKTGKLPVSFVDGEYTLWQDANPREVWMSRKPGAARDMIKLQLRMMANKLARIIHAEEFGIPVVAYSGSKGVHIYCLTGPVEAADAREAARIVLDAAGWEQTKNNFYRKIPETSELDLYSDFPQYSLEIFPKQDSLEGKDLGNLLRLPCGVNLKSPKDKAFFLDMREAMTAFKPMDPIEALTTTDIWK